MKKSFKILIFLMAFAFISVLNVRAEEVTCTGYKWTSGTWGDYSSGTAQTAFAPTCSTSGESYTEVETLSPGNSLCGSNVAYGCHRSRTWTKTATLLYPFSGSVASITVKVGKSTTVSASVKSQCTSSVSYSSADTSIATVSGSTVTGKKAGETDVIASYPGDSVCQAATDRISVVVEAAEPMTDPTITGASDKSVSQIGSVTLSLSANVNGSFSCTTASNYLTVASNCSSVNVTSLPQNNVPVVINYTFTPSDSSRYNVKRGSFNINLQGVANNKPVASVEPSSEIVAITPADGTVPVSFKAKDADGKLTQVKWSVTGEGIEYTCADNTTTCTVSFKNMGTDCTPKTRSVTVTATDSANNTKNATVTAYSYRDWAEHNQTGIVPSDAHNPTGMKYQTGCEAYDVVDKGLTYHKYYNRCCGGSSEQKVCLNCNGKYSWGLLSQNPSCTKVDSKNCNPDTETPSCYKCNGELKWGKYASNTSCTYISDKESDCEEKPYCYKNVDTGVYDWGKHENDNKWVKIAEITEQDKCTTPTEQEDPACYTKGGEYFWGKYKNVSGYTFTSLTQAQCKKFCYKEKATGNYVWGNYVGNDKYEVVASITDQNKCKAACYKCGKDYKWGPYAGDTNCEEVPKVTTPSDCDVPTPQTGLSVSNILYACGAFLVIMGSGIVVYQLTRVKKELD